MTKPPPLSVPLGLQEILKDYPELIQRLQGDLTHIVEKPSPVTPPLERAIWMLEDSLDLFISEARQELNAAEASGDSGAIARAKAKKFAVGSARANMGVLSDLRAYFSSWSQP